MKTTLAIINAALDQSRKPCLAYSGGADSTVLLDILSQVAICRNLPPIPLVFADSQMEYPQTIAFIQDVAKFYNCRLFIAKNKKKTPFQQWTSSGWPFLGKIAARLWSQKNGDSRGFKINVSECCRAMKIAPARYLVKNLGFDLQFTGQRGASDDLLRGFRTIKDGAIFLQARDNLTIANPLLGWTDLMIRRYTSSHNLPFHPAKIPSLEHPHPAQTIGCVFCGGGSQFLNSGLRILRHSWPEAWSRFIIDLQAGIVIIALKYNASHLNIASQAVTLAGGLPALASSRPFIFDFTRKTPIKGYSK